MKTYERSLELRHNNGFDSVLLVINDKVAGQWTVDDDVYKNFLNHGDLFDWDETSVDDDATDPEIYGELITRIAQKREYADGWEWSGMYPQRKQTH